MKRKWFLLFLILISTSLISGCWNAREIPDLAIVSAFGIDKNEAGKYVGTFQIINPGNLAGGLQGGGGGQGPPITVYSSTGDNIYEVTRRLSTKSSRTLYYAHTNLLIISEDLAKKDGITNILDAFERDFEFRTTAMVVIAHRSKAEDIIKTLPPLDKVSAVNVIKTLKNTERLLGEEPTVNLQEVIHYLVSPGKEPLISGISLKGEKQDAKKVANTQGSSTPKAKLEADGIAVMKDGKLVDWLHGKTARGTGWVLNRIKSTIVNINWEKEKAAIEYTVVRQKTKVTTHTKKGQPKISIHIRAEGDIGEVRVPVNLNDPHVLRKIEIEVNKKIKKDVHDAIHRAQENKTDIFGFGEAFHRSDPKEWNKLKADWNDVTFPKLEVDVTVDAFVRRSGLRNKSYLSELKNNR
ncbi:Ger(x)C family spore germination protein [Peribacillus sp. NPDC096379]|uniref:Ger(x)C family spore germination protein n=1 Tax=Peribacillus sp. NPDC096379 TaxID=3364393 RepID=UPI00381BFA16